MNDNELYKSHAENIEDINNYTDKQMERRLTRESIEFFARQKAILVIINDFMIAGQSIDTKNTALMNMKIAKLSFEMLEKFVTLYPQANTMDVDLNTNEVFQSNFEKILRGENDGKL